MRTATKLAAFGAGLALAVGGGASVGALAGPIDLGSSGTDDDHGHAEGDGAATTATVGDDLPGGLAVEQHGYRLVVDDPTVLPATGSELRFRVVDAAGASVTSYDEEHERDLHLVVVGRNLVDYAHLHPTLGPTGGWTVDVPALPSGSYRAFADFRPAGGEAVTLGVDLTVDGASTAADSPAPSSETTVDGIQVALAGEPRAGESELSFTLRREGEAVRTDPYLGAAGHLVAVRAADLAYLHVHPLDGAGDEIRFAAEFPSPGTYRLFLDFAEGGVVRTAAFTVVVPDAAGAAATGTAPTAAGGHEGGH